MAFVRTNDIDTYYEQRGVGPPVVFVHAAILAHSQWEHQVNALSDGYTTITYDIRGHGRTGGSEPASYSVELFADDLAALIAALDLEAPVICGLSLGGCIAQVYAATRPDEVAGIVLAETFTPEIFSRREWFQRSVMLRATIPFVRLIGYGRVETAMVWVQERLSRTKAGGDYEKVEQLREDVPKMNTNEFVKVIRAVAAFHKTEVDLAAISVPTLVLYGEHELPFVKQHAAKLKSKIPNAISREVPGAGHASNLDNPVFFEDALRRFLDGVAAEAA
ncbi:alpha/beta hydrolase (plasmid) [Haloferax mediterranei ATCC 33500]|uniref:Alpha/beta hydrolase n=1 Tax=Haloferax mediterranei (strain ATCC 33500 / DSM 1411 / JCM 8866 / NBRC 14739 / NCIMB 2177 / R-4) TaxID=523841 RepID=I3RBA4_HALMT|nr:alpha/beta hydrolase [Haloferax mediterranei]AFK21514.1 alpha/beta hydrolase fold protein / chloride peroxidase [Haloferax mediterranei ATCC 33500]AHZ24431.1 alpha/beta hydrolase [Haloferax mediterranei ATCC 33500]ELZ97172.1 alpha/beta hydrolase fold protein / chloride peroxidase [Haloferax mediterranei ATCC 33500]MDX5990084.1 alpha/beta hydrolase [Haloferax mediterranei ATCC 33500]QCQ76831.1 alpha/beta hydrolase [Haloferax mediterranei ATCC 33500]